MDNVKTAMETRANGAALLNEAGDFLMKQGLSNAKMAAEANKAEGESSMAPFAVIGGGKLRYETGSHVDSKSWHGAVGLAKQVNGLTFGVAIQQGKSNYDAYVNKAHSEGTSKSVGGALFAEKKIANGLHFDAAVRAGRVKNDYSAQVHYSIPDVDTFDVRFNESSAFYGISFGGGKEFNLKNKDKVDVYGRYAWTHTGSSEATTNWKDELKFDGINSHRILLGSRYTHAVNERNELYAGLGWQYELGGKVKGSIYGYSAPEPSLKGSSGLLELGWKAAAEENMTVDLNLSGWTGKQRGVMAGVNMQWKF